MSEERAKPVVEITPLDRSELSEKYEQWVSRIAANHGGANHRVNEEVSFVDLPAPLSDLKLALVTTAGAHLGSQEPFHVQTTAGDPSYRLIPNDVDLADIRFTHTHYDTASAEQDPNCVLPIDALNRAAEEGRIGAVSQVHIGMMGFNPDPTPLADNSGPEVAGRLRDSGVDAVVLEPG